MTLSKDNIYTLNELDYPEVNLRLMSNNLVYVLLKDECVLDIPLQMRLLDYYVEITNNTLMPFLFFCTYKV